MALALAFAPASAGAAIEAQARFEDQIAAAKAAMLTDPQAAVDAADQAQGAAAQMKNGSARGSARATALWLKAEALFRQERLREASPLIAMAFQQVRKAAPSSKLEADILLTRGSINGKLVHVAEALSDFQAAHRLFRRNGDTRREAIALICIANLYLDAKDYESVLRYLHLALESHGTDAGLAQASYNTRASVLKELERYDEADAAYREALRYARQLNSRALEAMFLRNMARNQLTAGKLDEAERTLAAARRLSGGDGDDRTQLAAVEAYAALQRGKLGEAARLVELVFADVDLSTTDIRFRDAHLTAVATYRAQGRPEKALVHLDALKRLDDRATKLATKTSNALMAARFDSANQDAKIARAALDRARMERKLFLIAGGGTAVLIVLLSFGIITIRRSRDQVRAANDDLAFTNGALNKALAAKTEFLATTSHEIRTPLNGILGMTQVMLADAGLGGATRDRLTVVHGAGLTMRALVDDILDVAKMETGNLGLECAPFDLPACLTDASAMWVEQARDKGLIVTVDLSRCPARVQGDGARVRQIVFNLLSNALKFTGEGGVSLVAVEEADGVRIDVTDTGIGIAPDKQAAVFEAFKQADASTTRQFGGTGLGLSICRSLAEAMGGTITLRSAVGEGSTFSVRLPLRALAAEPVTDSAAGCPMLLVVDRNPITRAMFRTLFASHAGAVAFASSLAEAEGQLCGDICQVLVDDATARAQGDARVFVADIVRAAGETPVTLLWPVAAAAERAELLALGLAQVVAKPVTGAALVEALFPETLPQPLVSQAA